MKNDTAICVWSEFDGEFAHIKGYICKPELNANGQTEPVDRYDHPLYSIRLHSQASKSYQWTGMYGMEVTVDSYERIGLRDAKKAVAILSPIERKLEKMNNEEGSVKSYGQWLNRVARAIGARTVFFKRDKVTASNSHYYATSGGDIVFCGDQIEEKIGEWASPKINAA